MIEKLVYALAGFIAGSCSIILIKPDLFTKVEIKTVTQYIVKKEEVKTNKKTNITKTTTKKDGTVTTTITSINEQKDQTTASQETQQTQTVPVVVKANFSIGGYTTLQKTYPFVTSLNDSTVTAGFRLFGSPVWLDLGYGFNKTFKVGGHIEL